MRENRQYKHVLLTSAVNGKPVPSIFVLRQQPLLATIERIVHAEAPIVAGTYGRALPEIAHRGCWMKGIVANLHPHRRWRQLYSGFSEQFCVWNFWLRMRARVEERELS